MTESARLRYEGDPTLARVMLQPRWIASLLLALIVAGTFAWLGQWQLGHAIIEQADEHISSEAARPLADLTSPGESITDVAAGMVVNLDGIFIAGDLRVVEHRENDGQMGAWVVGHLLTSDGGHLAVALGWAPDIEHAELAIAALESDGALCTTNFSLEGRYMPSDGATAPKVGSDPLRITSMSTGQLVNVWAPFDGAAYPGYLVLHDAGSSDVIVFDAANLQPINSVAPLPAEAIQWLNVFYAAEWVLFAGFAVYLWYRLARDDWERTHELRLLEELQQAQADPQSKPEALAHAELSSTGEHE